MAEDDLKAAMLKFRESVVADLADHSRQMEALREEVRRRITTAETAILNEVGDLGRKLDRTLGRIEVRLDAIEGRLGDSP